ncbi:SIS domain-containing protein [Nocardia sp. NPDC051981]|uniref:MurR/RpiR family transcriptional regulator n=1 Tax=Nocardia sp. NPDC051981 TaxID=3155417 RepID=UPI0034232A1C
MTARIAPSTSRQLAPPLNSAAAGREQRCRTCHLRQPRRHPGHRPGHQGGPPHAHHQLRQRSWSPPHPRLSRCHRRARHPACPRLPTTQAVDVARLEKGDCLITINIWRLTRTLRGLTRLARDRGATVSVLTDLRTSTLAGDADHLILAPIEATHAGPSLTGVVAAIQAILSELADDDAIRASGQIQQVWQDLDLMDDQP